MPNVVIVGAGPAGIAAASTIRASSDASITLLDEAAQPGGQIFRRPAPGLDLDMRKLLGDGYDDYVRFHAACDRVLPAIDYRPGTLAWNVADGEVQTLARGAIGQLAYDALILATGATDRIMPVGGWTLPGVFALGGAQVILKQEGHLIGRDVVFCGSSPLLYLAALQYARMGANVVAVLDTTPLRGKVAAIADLAAAPRILGQGLRSILALRRRGIAIHHGVVLTEFIGTDRLQAVRFVDRRGESRTLACDAAAFGHGLKAEAQLAELAGASMDFDPVARQWLPEQDDAGRVAAKVYVAGDGARIGGSIAAALSGARAARAVLADLGLAQKALPAEDGRLRRLYRFQRGLARAFAWPAGHVATLADHVVLCRCEHVTIGEVRAALHLAGGPREINRAKAATRCGMGRCQGRFCGPAAAELVRAEVDRSAAALPGRLRAQPPVKPLPFSALAESEEAAS